MPDKSGLVVSSGQRIQPNSDMQTILSTMSAFQETCDSLIDSRLAKKRSSGMLGVARQWVTAILHHCSLKWPTNCLPDHLCLPYSPAAHKSDCFCLSQLSLCNICFYCVIAARSLYVQHSIKLNRYSEQTNFCSRNWPLTSYCKPNAMTMQIYLHILYLLYLLMIQHFTNSVKSHLLKFKKEDVLSLWFLAEIICFLWTWSHSLLSF